MTKFKIGDRVRQALIWREGVVVDIVPENSETRIVIRWGTNTVLTWHYSEQLLIKIDNGLDTMLKVSFGD